MVIGIQDEILKINSQHLLDRLLMDKTTKSNIIWATDAYTELGAAYHRDKEITVDLITGQHSGVIKNRARKALEQQSERTRKHAEVFTPLWICEKMNDHIDEMWFGRKQGIHKTDPETGHIVFTSSKKWRYYVDSRRLEITCGEAPYLVSRYDVSTGDAIPLEKRIGILDRKLRAVTENAATEEEWVTWAIRAYQATYGYEFQGDNVLIARVNLLMTFEEYLYDRWKRKPTEKEYQTITNIICWNIWQMDGLSGTIPYCKAEEETQQISIFGWLGIETDSELKNMQPKCRINDWRRGNSVEFLMLNKGERKMKFDFIIGNPPYQEEAVGSDNKTFMPPIYDKFMDSTFEIADKVELIHPARFLFNAGQTPKAWNEKMLSDPHFKVLHYEPDASKVFANTEIKGGIAITYHDNNANFGAIEVFTKYNELNSILHKVMACGLDQNLTAIMANQNRFDLEALYNDYPEYRAVIGSNGKDRRFRNNIFDKVGLFSTDKKNDDDIAVLGVIKNKRQWRFFPKRYMDLRHENLDKWKVLIGAASGAGVFGETISSPIITEPLQGYTQTYIGVGAFDTRTEATNLEKYFHTKFLRTLLGILKITQHNEIGTWRMIPLQDFTAASDIDWSKSIPEIDKQLYAKYGLDEKEIAFIESHVKEMA